MKQVGLILNSCKFFKFENVTGGNFSPQCATEIYNTENIDLATQLYFTDQRSLLNNICLHIFVTSSSGHRSSKYKDNQHISWSEDKTYPHQYDPHQYVH